MKLYQLRDEVTLPVSVETAWDFFSDPHNLSRITPPTLAFVIAPTTPHQLHPGQIISYKVAPLLGIKITWVTEITSVIDKKLFVDEQRFGPYRFWHHEHHFSMCADGTKVVDIVHYALSFDPFSRLVHSLIVQPQLTEIFNFRKTYLLQRFQQ